MVSRERSRRWLAGADSVARDRCSATRRRRCAMSCVGWAVRTVSCSCDGRRTPFEPSQVQRPFEFERQHAAMACLQPDLQLREQALGGPHELRRGGGQRGEFDVQVELLGKLQPGIALGPLPIGGIQRFQQGRAETPRHPRPRQGPQIAPGAAADALQGGHMLPCRGQHIKRKIVRQTRRPQLAAQLQAQQAQGRQGGAGLRPLHGRQGLGFLEQPGKQSLAATPQAQRSRSFHQQGLVHLGHARSELQCPPAPGGALVFM